MESIKTETAEWLKENLKLQISQEKTTITDLTKQYCKFLGFRFRNNSQKAPVIKYIRQDKPVKQRASWGIFCDIEHERITNRMQYKKYIDHTRKPCFNTIFMQLKPHEIRYRYKMIQELSESIVISCLSPSVAAFAKQPTGARQGPASQAQPLRSQGKGRLRRPSPCVVRVALATQPLRLLLLPTGARAKHFR